MKAPSMILAMLLAANTSGCQSATKPPEKFDPSVWESPHAGSVGGSESVMVAEGSLPLVYQAMQSHPIHITDVTTHAQVAQVELRMLDIVRVDVRGIYVGDKQITGGPLAKDHQYMVYMDPAPGEQGVQWQNVRRGSPQP
jgi:hypothetical protein